MYAHLLLAALSASPTTPMRPNWANRPVITQEAPEYVAPLAPEKVVPPLPMTERIVVWNDGTEFKGGPLHTQLIVGGNAACLKFAAQITAIRKAELSAKCLNGDGESLFGMSCKTAQEGVVLRGRVIVVRREAVCEKAD